MYKETKQIFRKEQVRTMDYKVMAKQIVKAVGGRKNIETTSQCATRLRFHLKEEDKTNDSIISI